MNANLQYTAIQLKRALHLKEQIESLTNELSSILGGSARLRKGKNRMSAAGRAAIRAAQLKRWAKAKGK